MKLAAAALAVLVVSSPNVALAIGGGDKASPPATGHADLDHDGLSAQIDREHPPRSGRTAPYHYELRYIDGRVGCTDGVVEQVWRVYDDGTRELVSSGCPRFRGRRPVPPSAEQVKDAVGIPSPVVGV